MLIKEAIPVIVKKYEELSTNLSGQAHGLWTGLSATAATAVKLLPEMPPLRPPPPAFWMSGAKVLCKELLAARRLTRTKNIPVCTGVPQIGGTLESFLGILITTLKCCMWSPVSCALRLRGRVFGMPLLERRLWCQHAPNTEFPLVPLIADWTLLMIERIQALQFQELAKVRVPFLQPCSITHSVRNAVNACVVSWPTPLRFCVDHKLNAVGFGTTNGFPSLCATKAQDTCLKLERSKTVVRAATCVSRNWKTFVQGMLMR